MVVEIISVGTEILTGNIVNANAQFFSRNVWLISDCSGNKIFRR